MGHYEYKLAQCDNTIVLQSKVNVDLGPDYLYDLIEVRQHNKKADLILSVGIDLVLGTRQDRTPHNFRVCA